MKGTYIDLENQELWHMSCVPREEFDTDFYLIFRALLSCCYLCAELKVRL